MTNQHDDPAAPETSGMPTPVIPQPEPAEGAAPSFCFGVQFWNQPSVSAIFGSPAAPLTFCATLEEAVASAGNCGGRVLCWAGKLTGAAEAECRNKGIPLLRIEDGFIRSVGLGAGLMRAASLVFDDEGIYYDATRPSRLERLLETVDLTEEEQARAARLRQKIVGGRISKYNIGRDVGPIARPPGRAFVLVPGQVADDGSVRRSISAGIDCAGTENVNLDLLRAVRARNPDEFLVFKPHPDVEAGLRRGRVAPAELAGLADAVVAKADIVGLIDACDRVETFSSLTGFEALLRGKPVRVHGMPFYAGWGLTEDTTVCTRRRRPRSLDELVYIALVLYARTIDPLSLRPCTPEFLIDRLSQQRASRIHRLRSWILREASWIGRKLGI